MIPCQKFTLISKKNNTTKVAKHDIEQRKHKGTCQATPWGYLAPPLTPCQTCALTKTKDKGMCQATPWGYLAPPTDPMPNIHTHSQEQQHHKDSQK